MSRPSDEQIRHSIRRAVALYDRSRDGEDTTETPTAWARRRELSPASEAQLAAFRRTLVELEGLRAMKAALDDAVEKGRDGG